MLAHTADVAFRASAPDLAGVFEEAGRALAEIAADPSNEGTVVELAIELTGRDLPALAFAWLNELIGLADVRGPLVRADVTAVERSRTGGWRLCGRASFGGGARLRLDIKSATYHGLVVERANAGWRLTAYLDV